MLHMMEVVGTSSQGFSEAVRAALAELARLGKSAHFFQVVEQRGAVRGGEIKDFQVVLKVAVEG